MITIPVVVVRFVLDFFQTLVRMQCTRKKPHLTNQQNIYGQYCCLLFAVRDFA